MRDKDNDLVVVKANRMIQDYKYTLSKTELRVVNAIISNINSPKYDTELNIMEFDIKEFCELLGFEKSGAGGKEYSILKNTLRGLSSKTSDYIDFGDYETIVRWIDKPVFEKGSGTVKLKLDDDLKPFLLQANGYVQSKLHYYFDMNSKYSMRLYELLRSWDGLKQKEFSLEELRLSIDATKSSHIQFGKLKQSVLDPSVKEINDHTDLNISYTTRKHGKRVVGVVFTINKKTARELAAATSTSSRREISSIGGKDGTKEFIEVDYHHVEEDPEQISIFNKTMSQREIDRDYFRDVIITKDPLTIEEIDEFIILARGCDWYKSLPSDMSEAQKEEQLKEYLKENAMHSESKRKGSFYNYFRLAIRDNYAKTPLANKDKDYNKKGSFETDDFFEAALKKSYSED